MRARANKIGYWKVSFPLLSLSNAIPHIVFTCFVTLCCLPHRNWSFSFLSWLFVLSMRLKKKRRICFVRHDYLWVVCIAKFCDVYKKKGIFRSLGGADLRAIKSRDRLRRSHAQCANLDHLWYLQACSSSSSPYPSHSLQLLSRLKLSKDAAHFASKWERPIELRWANNSDDFNSL